MLLEDTVVGLLLTGREKRGRLSAAGFGLFTSGQDRDSLEEKALNWL